MIEQTDCPIDERHILYVRDGVAEDCSGCASAEAFKRAHVHTVLAASLEEPDWVGFCVAFFAGDRRKAA
jgi:hypothetical protein